VDYVVVIGQSVVCVVFGVAAVTKLRAPATFRAALRDLRVGPAGLVPAAAIAVPVVELAIAVAVPWAPRPALVAAAILLAGFFAGTALAIRRGSPARCACFGAATRPLGRMHLVRDVLLGAIALVAAAGGGDQHVSRPAAGIVIAAAVGLVLAQLAMALDDIADLLTSPLAKEAGRPWAS
jgi:hypothetical protein